MLNIKIIFLFIFINVFAHAQKTVEFRISTVFSDIGDMDGFLSGDSDPQWDATINDGATTGSFSLELSGTNCPGLRTVNTNFFSKAYNCNIAPSYTLQWRGFEDDGIGSDANTGLLTVGDCSLKCVI